MPFSRESTGLAAIHADYFGPAVLQNYFAPNIDLVPLYQILAEPKKPPTQDGRWCTYTIKPEVLKSLQLPKSFLLQIQLHKGIFHVNMRANGLFGAFMQVRNH